MHLHTPVCVCVSVRVLFERGADVTDGNWHAFYSGSGWDY